MGYAIFEADPQRNGGGRVIEAGTMKVNSKRSLGTRLDELARDVHDAINQFGKRDGLVDVVAVEFPAEKRTGQGGFAQQSVMSAPRYGSIVGVVWEASRAYPVRRIEIASDDWTRGKPGTKKDKDKVGRVELVEYLFGFKITACKTDAGNVADAVLIAQHAAMLIDRQQLLISKDPGVEIEITALNDD